MNGNQRRSVKAAVKRGAKLLDAKLGKGWARKVKVTRLELADCQMCVLGQLYGDYDTGIDELGDIDGPRHGFDQPDFSEALDFDSYHEVWASLNQLWRDEIRSRR